ncbi:MAG: T9SS type A sorting domain-containing protein [Cytophagaceae bacterium]|nr:T9SS type A sorting domain-containing protein [Cytophagaceae bacterium]MDW8457377.1 T9SS type A sorting domain-containing protein [Cytophagaceae bacterium]
MLKEMPLVLLFSNLFFCAASTQVVFKMYESPSLQEWQSARHLVKKKDKYYICGEMSHFQPILGWEWNGIIMCVDSGGSIIWQNNYGGNGAELLNKIVSSYNDNSLMAYGYTEAFFKKRSAWLLNIDTSGNINWQMTIKDSLNYLSFPENIESFKGGYIVSGSLKRDKKSIGCFISSLDNEGNTRWSNLYVFDSLQSNRANYAIYHVDDSLGYGFGIARDKIIYFQINLLNGDVVKVNSYKLKNDNDIFPMILYGSLYDYENNFYVLLGGRVSDLINYLILFKISTDGMIFWSKAYSFRDYPLELFVISKPTITKDKGVILGSRYSVISLLDSLGDVVFSNVYAYTSNQAPIRHIVQDDNRGYIAVGDILSNLSPGRDIVFFKIDANGETLGCCTAKRNLEIFFEDVVILNTDPINYTQANYHPFEKINISTNFNRKLNEMDACLNTSPVRRDTVRICEGDSVRIGGVYYSNPQTVVSTIKDSNEECDTLLFTTIEYWRPGDGDAYSMRLACPQDIEVYLDIDAQKAKVYYEYPELTTECYCNNHQIKLLEGIPSGGDFPLGVTKNCYEARDVCGNYSSCCFTVDVKFKDKPCDEKKIDCLSFHLLKVNTDSLGNRVFSCRVINECNSHIRYVYFELPKGMIAKTPSNLSLYVSQSGREYRVRNPHFSPFYSISFQPSGQLFSLGDSEIFEYTLPPQADVQYFKAAVRLASGKYYEVHLNTFKCIQKYTEQYSIRPIHKDLQSEKVRVMPNPVQRNGILHFNNHSGLKFNLYIYDITGRILYQSYSSENIIDMSRIAISTGVYLYTIVFEDNTIARGKLLVVD